MNTTLRVRAQVRCERYRDDKRKMYENAEREMEEMKRRAMQYSAAGVDVVDGGVWGNGNAREMVDKENFSGSLTNLRKRGGRRNHTTPPVATVLYSTPTPTVPQTQQASVVIASHHPHPPPVPSAWGASAAWIVPVGNSYPAQAHYQAPTAAFYASAPYQPKFQAHQQQATPSFGGRSYYVPPNTGFYSSASTPPSPYHSGMYSSSGHANVGNPSGLYATNSMNTGYQYSLGFSGAMSGGAMSGGAINGGPSHQYPSSLYSSDSETAYSYGGSAAFF